MAGAVDGIIDMYKLRKNRRAATQSYSCTARRFKKLISEMADIALVDAEYQTMVATYQRIRVLHREVVINTVDRAALDEADKYDDERRLEHDEYTRLFNEYRFAHKWDESKGDEENGCSRVVADSVVMDDVEDLEGNEEDTEAEDETSDDESEGDPNDGDWFRRRFTSRGGQADLA